MKKNFLCFLLTSTIIATSLVACNNSSNTSSETTGAINESLTSNDNATKNETSTTTSTDEEITTSTTEEPTTDSSTENTKSTSITNPSGSITYKFSSAVTGSGFNEQLAFTDNTNWSSNKTHYVNPDGDTMNFSWEAPLGMSEIAYSTSSGTALIMKNETGEYALRAFTTGVTPTDTFDATKSWTKEQIVACVHKDVTYIKDGYYDSNISDNVLTYTFAIESVLDEYSQKGYAYFIMVRDTGLCYQFYYLESAEAYDDARATKVIGSIKAIGSADFETDIEE